MKDKFLLEQDLVNNVSLSAESICVYVAMRAFCIRGDDEVFVSNSKLEYYLFGKKMDRNEHLAMKKGLKGLVDNGYISMSKKIGSTEYIYDCAKINKDEFKRYFYVYKDDIRRIMNLNTKYNRYKMLRYYICLLGSFYNNRNEKDSAKMKVGLLSQSKISELSGLSISTINEYNDILEKEKILYILKTIRSNAEGEIPKRQNIYSRYKDRDLCDEYCISRNIRIDLRSKIDESDRRKRDVEIYKNICNGKHYSEDIVKRVYDTMIIINDAIILGEDIGDEYENTFDLSVLENIMSKKNDAHD